MNQIKRPISKNIKGIVVRSWNSQKWAVCSPHHILMCKCSWLSGVTKCKISATPLMARSGALASCNFRSLYQLSKLESRNETKLEETEFHSFKSLKLGPTLGSLGSLGSSLLCSHWSRHSGHSGHAHATSRTRHGHIRHTHVWHGRHAWRQELCGTKTRSEPILMSKQALA